MKRLAVISYHTCPLSDETDAEVGGMNVYVLELSKTLAKKGCFIDIFTRSQDKNSPRIVEISPTLRLIHLPVGEELPLPKKSLGQYIPAFAEAVVQFMKDGQLSYDLVSCHYYYSGIIGSLLKNQLHVPFVITFHTLGLMKNLVARSDRERESIERIKSELQIVKEADGIIATSATDAEYIKSLYSADPRKVFVLKPGVNLTLFTPMAKSEAKNSLKAPLDQKLILFVGRIEPLKGIDVLLYALKILQMRNPDLRVAVWIVGGDVSGPSEQWPEELQKLAELRNVLAISPSVTFVGRKEQNELPNYYNAADLLVMPSHYESFGITAVEAMACGTPVITTDVTGVSDLFDEELRILLTSANNPILLSDKIKNLLTDEQLYQSIRVKVIEYVQHISWTNTANEFEAICQQLLKVSEA